MNHLLLYLLARELAPRLDGRPVKGVRILEPILVFDLGGRTDIYLVVYLASPGPFVWVSGTDPLPGLGESFMKRLGGSTIASADMEPTRDRVLRVPITGAGESKVLALYLHGSSSKVRLQADGTIVESLNAEEAGTAVPDTFGLERPFAGDIDVFALRQAVKSPQDPKGAVIGLDRELIEAFGGEDKFDPAAFIQFRDVMLEGRISFFMATNGRLGRVTCVPATAASSAASRSGAFRTFGPYRSVDAACAEIGTELLEIAQGIILSKATAPLRRRLQARARLLDSLRDEAAKAEHFADDRIEADILAAFQTQVGTGASEVELPDLYAGGKKRRITLDPALPLKEQIDKRYKRAAKRERSRAALATRINIVTGEIDDIQKTVDSSTRNQSLATGLKLVRECAERHGLVKQRKAAARATVAKEYRRFELGSGWFALVGRNDNENDEITFRIARPDDIWLHAQQTPGSHVVLKCIGKPDNPPNSILEAAARIAAHYSKAKHSTLVPVIYTRRKYVRKFRGARLGQVVCEREKTLFVEPKLPEE
jgi:hypothetical protein